MTISLFVEHHSHGAAFYINGDLQFDTSDEAIYHEYLVIPTLALAIQRFPNINLQILICGGGDGLAARDVLRFTEVKSIDLVDYNPQVIELAKTIFTPYNQNSLENEKIKIYLQEAFEFLTQIPDNYYHAIICDFTYPTCAEDTTIYSQEWFQQINRVLISGGIMSTNGVSPENRTTGFWCLYQTLLAAELKAKPLQIKIPSFQRHGYGNWGFFFASNSIIDKTEIAQIKSPENLQAFNHNQLRELFQFSRQIAEKRHDVTINTLAYPQLFYYLLNPIFEDENLGIEDIIDFLEIQESGNTLLVPTNPLQLESIIQAWLEQYYQSPDSYIDDFNIAKLLPVQHRYHSPKMTKEGLFYLKELLAEIDWQKLFKNIQDKSQSLPPKIADDINNFVKEIRSQKSLSKISPRIIEFMTILSVTLLLANFSHPDAVFAKGYSGSSGYSDSDSGESFNLKTLGILLFFMGGGWLIQLLNNQDNE